MIVETILARKGTEVATAPPDTGVNEAAALLTEKGIGALVVTGPDGAVAGVFSERDIVRGMAEKGAAVCALTVGDLMSRDVHSVTRRDTADQVMALMTDRRIRHLPVVENGMLLGIISIGDVVKNRIAETEQEAQALRAYIAT